jgi:hypothetical protein
VGGCALKGNLDLGRADAPDLQGVRGRLQDEGQLCVHDPRAFLEDGLETVLGVWSLLPLVEHEGGFRPRTFPTETLQEREHHGVASLHVRSPPAVDAVSLDPHRQTSRRLGYGIQVSGEDQPLA